MSINIDYISSDFESIVDSLINYASQNYGEDTAGNRQWSNFNIDDFSRTWLELVAYVSDLIFYYLEVQATQSNLETTTIRSVALNLAKQFGYVVPTPTSSSGLVKFTLSSSQTIPVGFRLAANNGSQFYVVSSTPAVGSTILEPLIQVIQGEQKSESFTGIGVQNEQFVLSFSPLVIDRINTAPAALSPVVLVNGNTYNLVDTFINSLPTDKHFRVQQTTDGRSVLLFGDDIFGKRINPNDNISVSYRIGGGSLGNIAANTLTSLVDSSTSILSVTNPSSFSGGSDEPSLNTLRQVIPAFLSTQNRAVTTKDYSDLILANFNEVAKASAERNPLNSSPDVNIYVVPQGSTITNITSNLTLYNSLTDFIDERKVVTTTFAIKDGFGVDVSLKIKIFIDSNVSKNDVIQQANLLLSQFFNLQTGDIDGQGTKFAQQIYITNLYSLLGSITGVTRLEIEKFTYIPRVEASTSIGANYLYSKVDTFDNTEKAEWIIVPEYSVTSPDNIPYRVFKKLVGKVSNISDSFITDSNLNLSVIESKSTGIDVSGANSVLFDSSKTFKKDEFIGGSDSITLTNVSGNTWDFSGAAFTPRIGDRVVQGSNYSKVVEIVDADTFVLSAGSPGVLSNGAAILTRDSYLLIDSQENIWGIIANDGHSIQTSAVALNNTLVTQISGGNYKIVKSLIGKNVVLRNNIFSSIDYNTHNTIFRSSSSFNLVGSINDEYSISFEQINKGTFGLTCTVDNFTSNTPTAGKGRFHVAGNVDLSALTVGINSNTVLIDSANNVYEVVGFDNLNKTVDVLFQSGTTPIPMYVGGKPASITQQYFSDDVEVSFSIGLANNTLGNGFSSIGFIQAIAESLIVEGETFTLNDGVNPAKIFEFDTDSSVSGSNIPVDISIAVTADDVKTAIINAINGATSLDISASSFSSSVVFLSNDNLGTAGNQTITDTVADTGFIVYGMSGGLSAGSISTPTISGSSSSPNELGYDSGNNKIDSFTFRTSDFLEDITNLRNNEIPQFNTNNLSLDIRGGIF
jgi:hypothetical protein